VPFGHTARDILVDTFSDFTHMERVLPQPAHNAAGRRKSVFLEVGLVDEGMVQRERSPAPALISERNPRKPRARAVRFRSKNDIFQEGNDEGNGGSDDDGWESASDSDSDVDDQTTLMRTAVGRPRIHRLGFLAIALGVMLSIFQVGTIAPLGVIGGVIPRHSIEDANSPQFWKRDDTQVDVCTRWSGQCKLLLGSCLRCASC
jgi:hypothetical protein